MSQAVEGFERAEALLKSRVTKKSGLAPSKVDMPSFRAPWVCKRIFDLNGDKVLATDKRHPCRSVEVEEVHFDDVEAASESTDEFIADLF